jgi:hypothetical protein
MTYSLKLISRPNKEGAAGTTGSYVYEITRANTSSAETLQWIVAASDPSTSNNRGANALDFGGTFPSGASTFASGQASQTFSFDVVGDNFDEFDTEIFNVGILNTTTVIEGTITDDDDVSSVRSETSPELQLNSSINTWVSRSDSDTYRMTLKAGVTYEISSKKIEGNSVNFGHFDVLDSFGVKLVSYVDSDSSTKFIPTTSGLYFLSLYSDYNHGGYAISLSDSKTITSATSVTLPAAVENLILVGYSNINAIGNFRGNIFTTNFGDDSVDGGDGIDSVKYNSNSSSYRISNIYENGKIIFKVKNVGGIDGMDTLVNIERLQFLDKNLAIDLDGNAGKVVKILGAVFGSSSVANKSYVGIGLSYLDGGMSYVDLMQLAIDARLGGRASNVDVVNLLYKNVFGGVPDAELLALYKGFLDNGFYTQGSLGVLAADTSINTANINLIGMVQTGVEFIL